jgi:hypothetical protein
MERAPFSATGRRSIELDIGCVGGAEPPASGRDVVRRDDAAVVGPEAEGEALAVEVGVALPVGAPVAAHGHPARGGALDPRLRHHAAAAHVGDGDQLEVAAPLDGEPDAAGPAARDAAVVAGTIPARYTAMASHAGCDMSKWRRGGLHQPPASPGSAQLGGHRLVAVTVTEAAPGLHHRDRPASQAMAKHAPHMAPLLNSAVLSAVERVPYPASYRLPYPHAPPDHFSFVSIVRLNAKPGRWL